MLVREGDDTGRDLYPYLLKPRLIGWGGEDSRVQAIGGRGACEVDRARAND